MVDESEGGGGPERRGGRWDMQRSTSHTVGMGLREAVFTLNLILNHGNLKTSICKNYAQ